MRQLRQTGAALIVALFLLLAMTLISVSLSRMTRSVLAVSGNAGQTDMLIDANDQGIAAAKANILAVPGVLEANATNQAWYNTGTGAPDAGFWQNCTATPATANSCVTQAVTVNGQAVTLKYMVRGTGLTHVLSISGASGQVTAAFYQIFVNATTADGASQTVEAWYLRV